MDQVALGAGLKSTGFKKTKMETSLEDQQGPLEVSGPKGRLVELMPRSMAGPGAPPSLLSSAGFAGSRSLLSQLQLIRSEHQACAVQLQHQPCPPCSCCSQLRGNPVAAACISAELTPKSFQSSVQVIQRSPEETCWYKQQCIQPITKNSLKRRRCPIFLPRQSGLKGGLRMGRLQWTDGWWLEGGSQGSTQIL